LSHEIEFYIITRDRDVGSESPYPDLPASAWKSPAKVKVRYLAPAETSARHLTAAVRELDPHAIYLNSFFAPMSIRLLVARRLGALEGIPILLAPRGELSQGALSVRAFKKSSFIQLSTWIGLYRDVAFHATNERERDEISRALPAAKTPRIARNPITIGRPTSHTCSKIVGTARFVFLSLITEKKNLYFALNQLRFLKGSVEFNIYGPVIDEAYWRRCQALIDQMPPNVAVRYHNPVPHCAVARTISAHQFFLMPTANENFGHALVEALLAGCPVITSDQTPWRGLAQRGAGWDLPLDDTNTWRRVLQTCVDMDAVTYERSSLNARSFGNQIVSTDTVDENLGLFRATIATSLLNNRPPEGAA
jgi:glycosyltransferase involved in cell wall biosynthesis